jgi:hypothetical protein
MRGDGEARETTVERLARYLFDGASAPVDGEGAVTVLPPAVAVPFEIELAGWLAASARYRAFVEANRDKIRKKLRTTPDPEARRDVRAELLTARLLVADRRIQLGFETYGSGKAGPDFTVSFPGERSFNLEVTRPRRAPEAGLESQLLAKLRQLPAGAPNAVLLTIDGGRVDAADVDGAVHTLRRLADRRDDLFFTGRGFEGARGFYDRFLRLGGVFLFGEAWAGEPRAELWINRSARIVLPERPARACLQALRAV